MPEDPTLASWRELRETLAGSFAARARGLFASEFSLLDGEGREVGSLRLHGPEGAELKAGKLSVRVERTAPGRYAMLDGAAEVLSAEDAGSPDAVEITCAGRPYEARLSLLRNTADAHPAPGESAARITGGLTNLRYDAALDAEDAGALPVAVFLLYRLAALRRGAYRAGAQQG
jgi:hypothetical protein